MRTLNPQSLSSCPLCNMCRITNTNRADRLSTRDRTFQPQQEEVKSQEVLSLSSPGWLRAKINFSPKAKISNVSLHCLFVKKHTIKIQEVWLCSGMTGLFFPSLKCFIAKSRETAGSFSATSVGGEASTYLFPQVLGYAKKSVLYSMSFNNMISIIPVPAMPPIPENHIGGTLTVCSAYSLFPLNFLSVLSLGLWRLWFKSVRHR